VDKLESIPNFNTSLNAEDFKRIVNEVGVCIIGQTAKLAPADKKLYALRDVTATVDSLPLIVSSIMGKKLCMDDDCIVLDVKTGSGSFMKTIDESRQLATLMVELGKKAGKNTMALITDMDAPLGNAIGNSLEVLEAVSALKGNAPKDYTELCVELSASILSLANYGDYDYCKREVLRVIKDGSAYQTFKNMVKAQGGDETALDDAKKFKQPKFTHQVFSKEQGYICSVDAESYGKVALLLGAGRATMEDIIDSSAGIILNKKRGDFVKKGELLATFYTDKQQSLQSAENAFLLATKFSSDKPNIRSIVIEKVF
jgi:pyrimidine-nucleoside phosphorylase